MLDGTVYQDYDPEKGVAMIYVRPYITQDYTVVVDDKKQGREIRGEDWDADGFILCLYLSTYGGSKSASWKPWVVKNGALPGPRGPLFVARKPDAAHAAIGFSMEGGRFKLDGLHELRWALNHIKSGGGPKDGCLTRSHSD